MTETVPLDDGGDGKRYGIGVVSLDDESLPKETPQGTSEIEFSTSDDVKTVPMKVVVARFSFRILCLSQKHLQSFHLICFTSRPMMIASLSNILKLTC